MALDDTVKTRISNEIVRLEEDCSHSGKAHFNASSRWNKLNYWFGIPSVIISAVIGTAFFKDYALPAGIGSAAVTVLTALVTFLKPAEKATEHKNSGDQYLALKNDARVFRELTLQQATDEGAVMESLVGLTTRRNELNQASSMFSDNDFQKARAGVNAGEALHAVDKQ
ncbi:SLATT domain-containing protein [Rhizobium sp. 62_C5_N11_2]|uniref:SLATT domain-containing protein n=1 Tax=Rhizobium sp. 62_C5_N11_2 TaxID=3240772 RepID=UPI003F287EE6